jgi:hypothetical protein
MALVLRILSVHVMGAGGALTLSTMQRVIIYVLTHLGTRKAGKMAHEGKKAMFLESY